jgi:tryptophanyl-tRNA synthetase
MRILSGTRPTGKLHLGNYFGAIKRYIELQESGADCFFCIVDWHTLTTDYADPSQLQNNVREVLLDWLACGIDPKKSTIFLQSQVKEHAELFLLLSMITPLGWLTRVPTYKEQQQELKEKDLNTFGFLGYPVLQAADILLYKATGVPVGEDQLPHLEMTRELIRRMNFLYKTKLPEPASLLTPTPRIAGTDGRKMSKSYGNAIYLSDSPEQISKQVMSMITDTKRIKRTDPGDPERCNLYPLHRLVSDSKTCTEVDQGCRAATLGSVAL